MKYRCISYETEVLNNRKANLEVIVEYGIQANWFKWLTLPTTKFCLVSCVKKFVPQLYSLGFGLSARQLRHLLLLQVNQYLGCETGKLKLYRSTPLACTSVCVRVCVCMHATVHMYVWQD